jgi:hypothetical protein
MRTRLLGSFLFVLAFWWLVMGFWWATAPPQEALQRLTSAAALLPWARHLPPLKPTVFDFWSIQRDTALLWTGPLTLVWVSLALACIAIVWALAHLSHRRRVARLSPSAAYRGVGITMGALPAPALRERTEVSLDAAGKELRELLSKIEPSERALLEDLLAMLAASGIDSTGPTLERIERALSLPEPGLAGIVEVACDLGESAALRARALSSLPSWWSLPPVRRYGVLLAVKHRGEALKWVPQMTGLPDASKLARELLFALDGSDAGESAWKKKGPFYLIEGGAAVQPETSEAAVSASDRPPEPAVSAQQSATAAQPEPADGGSAPAPGAAPAKPVVAPEPAVPKKPAGLLDIFCRELPNLPLRLAGVAASKKIVPMGWKKKGRLYLIERALAETLWHKLPQALKDEFQEAPAGPRSPVTRALLEVLHLEGWLVTRNGLDELAATDALWVVRAGKIDFKGVIVLSKLPESLMDQLPTDDSPFDMTILRPLFFASRNPEREHPPGEELDRQELAANIEAEIASASSVSKMNLDMVLGKLLRPAGAASPASSPSPSKAGGAAPATQPAKKD